jgi:hypothetical protein
MSSDRIDCIVKAIRANPAGGSEWRDGINPPNKGYCVAIAGFEDIIDLADCSDFALRSKVERRYRYIHNIDHIACVGWWSHDGKLYLDVSIHISDRDSATDFAVGNNQIAIWDIANNAEVKV